MEVPLIAGPFFSDHDSKESEAVAIIDQKFAQRFWPNGGAVGKHLWIDPKKPMVIAGVVGNVKQYGLDSDAKIAVYFPNTHERDGFLVEETVDLKLTDKVVLVTGSTAGIGFAIARSLASEGAHVYLNGRTQERVNAAMAAIRSRAAAWGR